MSNSKEYSQAWRASNKEKLKEYQVSYRAKHKEKLAVTAREYQLKNKDLLNQKYKDRRKTDVNFKLAHSIRNRLNKTIRAGSGVELLGCSVPELKSYLESKFTPEMNWSNYGSYWHIDHIRPLSSFDLTNLVEMKVACHFSNLQPLTAKDNRIKHNKIVW